MSAKPVLETENLTIRFGGHIAVNNVSCKFYPGTLTAIVGPNGAGKTTYFNLISGQLPASSGKVLLRGDDITKLKAPQRTHRGIGRAFQLTMLFPALSVLENVRLAVASRKGIGFNMYRMADKLRDVTDRAMHYLERVSLKDKAHVAAATLPHGDQRKLEVGILLALEPEIFMFDEPTAGMSVDEVPVIPRSDRRDSQARRQDHSARRAQDGRGALLVGSDHRAAQRPAPRGRPAGGSDQLRSRAGGIPRSGAAKRCRGLTVVDRDGESNYG
jgi:branched-chain amino acid transport system ATP-binding protein